MIGYYVHHVGHGHRVRAQAIAGAVEGPVVALTSLAEPPGSSAFADWIVLDRDDQAPAADDPTAHGAMHWIPRHDEGLLRRSAALAAWVARERPACVVVDVSAEIAVLVRLLGVPVVVVAMPGERSDPAHQLALRVADAVLAFWPPGLYEPPWLTEHADRVHYVGALSRFDGRPSGVALDRYGVVLSGSGGDPLEDSQLADLPDDRVWHLLGGTGAWSLDPWSMLCGAEVVVTHAGQNALAEVAAARRPAVVVPRPRPHQEQVSTCAVLERAGIAVCRPDWPGRSDWPGVIDEALSHGGSAWQRWNDGWAAERAARVVSAVAAGRSTGASS